MNGKKSKKVLSLSSFNLFVISFSEKASNLSNAVSRNSSSQSIEMKKLAIRFTIDSIISCACGLDCNTLLGENEDVVKISQKIFGSRGLGQFYIFFLFAFPEAAKKLNMKQFGDDIEDFFKSVLEVTIRHRETNEIDDKHDFLDMMIQLMRKGKIDGEISTELQGLEFEDLVAQVFIIFFAGFETSATTISFALAELAANQEMQARLRKGIYESLDRNGGELTYDSLHELVFLSHIIDGEF